MSLYIGGCSPGFWPSDPVQSRDLVGNYQVKWVPDPWQDFGQEKLTLRSDGTFQQIFTPSKGRASKNTGTWKLEHGPTGPEAHLAGIKRFVSRSYDVLVNHPRPEDAYIPVFKHGRRIQLMIDEDNELYYTKKP